MFPEGIERPVVPWNASRVIESLNLQSSVTKGGAYELCGANFQVWGHHKPFSKYIIRE